MAEEKILVVDDSPTELQLITEPLIARGFRVITATNGIEALETARREHPSLILLDVLMPGKNGFQVCRQLKSDPATSGIKIMFVSSKNQQSEEVDLDRDIFSENYLGKLLDLSTKTIQAWRQRGIGPPFYKLNGTVRYSKAEVDKWLKSNECRNTIPD